MTPKNENTLISIGLPVYNGADTVERALASLVDQKYSNVQIIISDNASTDNTLEICERFANIDSRITIIKKSSNEGALENFKTVLKAADGEFFMWAAADDCWDENFVVRLLPILQADPECGVAMCAVRLVNPHRKLINHVRFDGDLDPANLSPYSLSSKMALGAKYNLFIYGLFRREILAESIDDFPDVLGGDRQYIIFLSMITKFAYLDEVLLERTHQEKNAEKYISEFSRILTPFNQIRSFVKITAKSLKICRSQRYEIPLICFSYILFILKQYFITVLLPQANKDIKIMTMRIISRKGLATILLFLALGGVASVYSGVLDKQVAAVAFGSAALFLIQLAAIKRWFISYNNAALRKLDENVFSESRGFSARDSLFLAKEMRYLTDTLIHARLVPAENETNGEMPVYATQQLDRQRKMLEFTRNLEQSKIREVYLAELFAGIEKTSVPIGVINELSGHPNKADMLYVASVAKHTGAKNIFEFGTYMGRTTFAFAHNNPEAEVVTLNLPAKDDPNYAPYIGVLLKGTEEEKRVTRIEVDSQSFDTAPHSKKYDFIFVDAGHTYDLVKNDTEKAFELLKPGGIIMWHDYAPKSDGLVRYFKELTQDCPLFRIRSTCLLVYVDGIDVFNHELHKMPETLESAYRKNNPLIPESLYHLQ